jgi:hypothetical protein
MAVTLSKLAVKSFERIVRHLAQQTDTRLRPYCMERNETGSTRNWGRMAKRDALVAKNGRAATPNNDSVWSNRVSVVATYHDADQTEQEDINTLLIDPNSEISQALGAAARRTTDDVIIAAATGNALDEAGGNNAFPAGQVFGDYTTEIDFPAVTAIAEMFLANDIDPSERKVAVVGSKQARKLLHIVQATNREYIGQASALVGNGFVSNWMGFDWILSNRLLKPQAGQIGCLFFTRKALGLQVSKDIWARVAEDPSQSFAWRIYIAMTMGAVRVEDEHIVWAKFADTCTVV